MTMTLDGSWGMSFSDMMVLIRGDDAYEIVMG